LKSWLWCGTFIIVFLGCAGCSQKAEIVRPIVAPVESGVLMIAGSGSNLALTRRLAVEYSRLSGEKIDIPGNIGTSGAVKAIREGAIPLGLASRSLTPEEKSYGLRQIHYASIGLAIAVNSSVPDRDIDKQTLVQIVAEEKTAWSNGACIVPLLMFARDSTNVVLQKDVPNFTGALQKALDRRAWQILYSDEMMLETLNKTPNSIGFIDAVVLADHPGKIRAMTLNGTEITTESLQTGRYPLKKDLYFIYRGTLSNSAKKFIDFCFSDSGWQFIVDRGAVPYSASESME